MTLKMWILIIVSAAVLIGVVWHFFMAPLEKQMHERRLEMIRRKIEKREQAKGEKADDGEV